VIYPVVGRGVRSSFGDCEFDTGTRQLLRDGVPVSLTPKAYQLLELLLTERPKAVSKGQVFERLWPETFVSEANLASLIFEVRAAIGDHARAPKYVRTVRGFGYAFCGEVEGDDAPPAEPAEEICFRLIWGEREIALSEGENILGRTHNAVVWIGSSTVSRRHARIVVENGRATLEDLGSKNGTRLNGEKVTSAPLADDDVIRLGSVAMTFRAFAESLPTQTEGPDE